MRKKYKVLHPIIPRPGAPSLERGEVVELPEEVAKNLVRRGQLKPIEKPKPKVEKQTVETEKASVQDATKKTRSKSKKGGKPKKDS